MDESVPATSRVNARIAFIRALAARSDAVSELRSWRQSEVAADSEGERWLFEHGDGHPFFEMAFTPSRGSLLDLAGSARVQAASAWAARWNLDVEWLRSWAVFALVIWEAMRRCNGPDCSFECRRVRESEAAALEMVTAPSAMLAFGEEPLFISMLARHISTHSVQLDDLLPPHKRAVSAALPGPHPLLETKAGFLNRAKRVWEASVRVLESEGLDLAVPRKQKLHSEWLVCYCVLGQTAAAIVSDSEHTDTSTVYKAVNALAEVIDLPIRGRET